MRVAAYQAPYRDYPAADGAELVAARLRGLRDRGVDVLCCPEALIGELANESDGAAPPQSPSASPNASWPTPSRPCSAPA